MSDHYLLTCSCGQKLVVAPRQAGQPVTCLCGKKLEVPPLGEMARLEPVTPEANKPGFSASVGERRAWGARQAGLFLGLVLLCAGVPWAVWLELSKPRLVPVDRMPPLQTWAMWQELRTGADRVPSAQAKAYAEALKQNRYWLAVAIGLSVAGLVVTVASYALLKPPVGKQAGRPPI